MNFFSRLPSRTQLEAMGNVPENTLDLAVLQQRPQHLVFDYGVTLKFPRVTDAYTVTKMCLWQKHPNGDGISVIAMRTPIEVRAHIAGTVHLVQTDDLVELDKWKQNGVLFRRKRLRVYTPHIMSNGQLNQVEAWAYVGISSQWAANITWEKDFYKGRGGGQFKLSQIHHGLSSEYPQLQLLQHYRFYKFKEDLVDKPRYFGPSIMSQLS